MRNINPFGLRLQPELKARLEEAAKHNKRSLNAEISARLEASFKLPEIDMDQPLHGKARREENGRVIETHYSGPSAAEMFRLIGELAEQVRILKEGPKTED